MAIVGVDAQGRELKNPSGIVTLCPECDVHVPVVNPACTSADPGPANVAIRFRNILLCVGCTRYGTSGNYYTFVSWTNPNNQVFVLPRIAVCSYQLQIGIGPTCQPGTGLVINLFRTVHQGAPGWMVNVQSCVAYNFFLNQDCSFFWSSGAALFAVFQGFKPDSDPSTACIPNLLFPCCNDGFPYSQGPCGAASGGEVEYLEGFD